MKGIEFLEKLPTVCPFCTHQLAHIEKELNIILIDDKGMPESEKTNYVNKLLCINCGEEFEFTKNGFIISLGKINQTSPGKLYKRSHYIGNSNGFGYFNNKEEE